MMEYYFILKILSVRSVKILKMLGKRSKIEESYRNITLPAAILNRSPLKASKIS